MKKNKVIGQLSLVIGLLALVLAGSGCASIIWNQHTQAKQRAAIRGVALAGGGAGIGVSLFDLGSLQTAGDWAGQIGAAVVDGFTAYAAYEATKGSGSSDPAPVIPAITTGNNSPVQVNVGSGNAGQANPNVTTSTSSTGARRH